MSNTETNAAIILSTAVDFLASKYSCTAQEVVAALAAGNLKVRGALNELIAAAIPMAAALVPFEPAA